MLIFALHPKHDIRNLSDLNLPFPTLLYPNLLGPSLLTGTFRPLGSGAAVAQAADNSRVACRSAIGQVFQELRYVLHFS